MYAPWQLLTTAPHAETHVASMLSRFDFPHWLFKYRRRLAHRGRIVERLAPAFPGYIFVQARNAWEFIRGLHGASSFVEFGDGIADVPEHVVTGLVAAADAEGVLPISDEVASSSRFKCGDRLRIRGGPASGYNAIFQHLMHDDRALVLIDWMGRWVPINVHEADLELERTTVRGSSRRSRGRRRRRCHSRREITGATA